MKENLTKDTTHGILWSFIARFLELFVQFVLITVLSRLLAPEDFASVGLLTVFSLLSSIVIDSGFSQALIRKTEVDKYDLSSVFFFNLFIGLLLYIILFVSSSSIADFYNIPELETISKILFLRIIFYSLSIIPHTLLVRSMSFKKITLSSVLALTLSAIVGIISAFNGFGVYSLVIQLVSHTAFNLCFLYLMVRWHPIISFKWGRVREMMSFSLNLLGTGLITAIFNNLYTLLIGKIYPQRILGYYSQAKKIEDIPSQSITSIIQNVSYSSMSKVKDDNERLKRAYKKVLELNIFIVLPIMTFCYVSSENFIPILLGEKWLPIVPIFRVLCVYGAIFPLFSVNTNILKVKGLGKLVLKQEIVRRLLMVISIILTYRYGIIIMLWGWVVSMLISILYSFNICGKPIDYKVRKQLLDILPYFLICLSVSIIVGLFNLFNTTTWLKLFAQMSTYSCLFMWLSQKTRLSAYQDAVKIIRNISIRQFIRSK